MKDLNLWSTSPEEERSSQKQFLSYFFDSDFEVIRMKHVGQKKQDMTWDVQPKKTKKL